MSAPNDAGESALNSPEGLRAQERWASVNWQPVRNGRVLSLKWDELLSFGNCLDPYLIWADITAFAGFDGLDGSPFRGAASHEVWPFLVELWDRVLDWNETHPLYELLQIPQLYVAPTVGEKVELSHRFITARIRAADVPAVLQSPMVRRLQLGLPRLPGTGRLVKAAAPDSGPGLNPRVIVGVIDDGCPFSHPSFCSPEGVPRVHFLWDQDPDRSPNDEQGWSKALLAGYGAELRHEGLKQAALLGRTPGDELAPYKKVNYGPVKLDLFRHGTRFDAPDAQDRLPAGTMLTSSHGAGALFLAAGMTDPALGRTPIAAQRATASGPPVVATKIGAPPAAAGGAPVAPTDHADKWPVIFVQLPTRTILDTSGGSLGVHVLDGVRYIMDRASRIPLVNDSNEDGSSFPTDPRDSSFDPKTGSTTVRHNLVINVSYGATAGPHDGTSMLEQALAEIVELRQWTWICVAAGNSHRAQTHARVLVAPGQSKSFLWNVGPDNPFQSFLEVWFPETDQDGYPLSPRRLRGMSVSLTSPEGAKSPDTLLGSACALFRGVAGERPVHGPLGAVVFCQSVVQGLKGTMVLIALAPTGGAVPNASPVAAHGRWIVTVNDPPAGDGESPGRDGLMVVHAWAERNDLVFGNRRRQQGTVIGEDPTHEPTEYMPDAMYFADRLERDRSTRHLINQMEGRPSFGSLSGASSWLPGISHLPFYETGRLVTVGAYRLADGELADYSSGGPNRHSLDREPGRPIPDQAVKDWAFDRNAATSRNRVDVTAPADVGPAVRGLRVIGTRPGLLARMSGTSAAAPSAVRAVANYQFAALNEAQPPHPSRFGLAHTPQAPNPAARPTPTPAKDDKFRSGKWRISPD